MTPTLPKLSERFSADCMVYGSRAATLHPQASSHQAARGRYQAKVFLSNTSIAARTSAPLLSCGPLLAGQQGLLQLILGGGSTCPCHLMQALRLLAPGVETPHNQLPGDGRQQRCQQDGQGPRGRQLQQPVGVQSAHGGPMAVMDGPRGNHLVAAATAQSGELVQGRRKRAWRAAAVHMHSTCSCHNRTAEHRESQSNQQPDGNFRQAGDVRERHQWLCGTYEGHRVMPGQMQKAT